MKKSILILMMMATGFFCYGQSSTDSVYTGTDSIYVGALDSTKNVQSQKSLTRRSENNFNTKYEYTESNGARLVIQNSFPKSGINYTDPNGRKYIYAVFWTQISNETFDPLDVTIDFPLDSFEIASSSGNYMRLLLPSDTMTIDKEPLYDYGLTIKSFLDNNRHKSSSLKRTINPKSSSTFYVVTLSNHGSGGILRAGLNLKGQNLFYKISCYSSTPDLSLMDEKEINCGSINLKNLMLRK